MSGPIVCGAHPDYKLRERNIETYLVRCVRDLGGEVRKVQWIGRSGAPDRLVMLPRRYRPDIDARFVTVLPITVWVELKAPGKKPTAAQLREHERLRAVGQWVVVVDSLEAVDALLA